MNIVASIDASKADRYLQKGEFVKPYLESDQHPLFKNVWTLNHTLDAESPLLCDFAKKAIHSNQGFWPTELNHAEAVRNYLNFDKLMVSFSGTSNADANPVYAQKVYDCSDVRIWYRFSDMMHEDDDGMFKGDLSVIDKVTDQLG
jgi:hypothetical protein